jgi:beta-lactamase class A
LQSGEEALMLTADIVSDAARRCGLEPSSFVAWPLDGGPRTEVRTEADFYPASMIKTPLAVVAYDAVEAGELALTDRFEVTEANMTSNDAPSPLVPGYRSELRELIELMITISDNVATNMFFDILGRDRATETIQRKYHLAHTTFRRKVSGSEPLIVDKDWDRAKGLSTHPPLDAAAIFTAIARDEVPYADALRATLSRQHFNAKLAAGLREGDRFEHKTGSTDNVSHDGGILRTAEGRSYVIVTYTGFGSDDETDGRFVSFMRELRPLL